MNVKLITITPAPKLTIDLEKDLAERAAMARERLERNRLERLLFPGRWLQVHAITRHPGRN